MVYERDDIEGLDASILMHPKVWKASGHMAGFLILWSIVKCVSHVFARTRLILKSPVQFVAIVILLQKSDNLI